MRNFSIMEYPCILCFEYWTETIVISEAYQLTAKKIVCMVQKQCIVQSGHRISENKTWMSVFVRFPFFKYHGTWKTKMTLISLIDPIIK